MKEAPLTPVPARGGGVGGVYTTGDGGSVIGGGGGGLDMAISQRRGCEMCKILKRERDI